MIQIKLASQFDELVGIKDLQQKNLGKNLSKEEAAAQGFVTAEYTVDFLQEMHDAHPSVIAKEGNEVVGYALVATHDIRDKHPLLADLFQTIDKVVYKGQPLRDYSYVVVGQLCVAKNYRGQGLVSRMYELFKTSLQDRYEFGITDVVQTNTRSLKAHIKTGFQVIDTLEYEGMKWDIVLWELR